MFSVCALAGETCLKVNKTMPPIVKVAASIASAQVGPQPATMIPPTAAPKIIAPLEKKLFTELVP